MTGKQAPELKTFYKLMTDIPIYEAKEILQEIEAREAWFKEKINEAVTLWQEDIEEKDARIKELEDDVKYYMDIIAKAQEHALKLGNQEDQKDKRIKELEKSARKVISCDDAKKVLLGQKVK